MFLAAANKASAPEVDELQYLASSSNNSRGAQHSAANVRAFVPVSPSRSNPRLALSFHAAPSGDSRDRAK